MWLLWITRTGDLSGCEKLEGMMILAAIGDVVVR